LAAAGNGIYFERPGVLKLSTGQEAVNTGDSFWHLLFGTGLAFYLLAFALQRVDP